MSASANVTTSVAPSPPGQHPHLLTSLSLSPPFPRPPSECVLSLMYWHLPSELFLDVYQLASLGSSGVRTVVTGGQGGTVGGVEYWGERDLEEPAVALSAAAAEGGGALVPLWKPAQELQREEEGPLTIEVDLPLHARYLRPIPSRSPSGWANSLDPPEDTARRRTDLLEVVVAPPDVVWHCLADTQDSALRNLPLVQLSRRNMPQSLLSSNLYKVPTTTSPSPTSIWLPTGVSSDLRFVEPVTAVAVWSAATWVGWKAWRKSRRWATVSREKAD